MQRYQIIMRPQATATGERGKWTFRAHGATHSRQEAMETCERLAALGYDARKIRI